MSGLEAIAAIRSDAAGAALAPDDLVAPDRTATQAVGGGFGGLVTQGLAHVNEQLLASQVDMQKLATGEAVNLHQVMINLEESRLSFQLMMQVRSRLLEAYQDVMRMQV